MRNEFEMLLEFNECVNVEKVLMLRENPTKAKPDFMQIKGLAHGINPSILGYEPWIPSDDCQNAHNYYFVYLNSDLERSFSKIPKDTKADQLTYDKLAKWDRDVLIPHFFKFLEPVETVSGCLFQSKLDKLKPMQNMPIEKYGCCFITDYFDLVNQAKQAAQYFRVCLNKYTLDNADTLTSQVLILDASE